MDNAAASAAIRYLRKDSSSGDGELGDRADALAFGAAYPHREPQIKARSCAASVARDARTGPRDPCAAVPARPAMGQRGAPAHGQAARPPRARRVLGLLPRQLIADAPLPDGLARALRVR